jgi:hypothetical protein
MRSAANSRLSRTSAGQSATAASISASDSRRRGGKVEAVEAPGELDQGLVAAGADIAQDGGDRLADVVGLLALGGEQGGEPGLEVRIACPQPLHHGP